MLSQADYTRLRHILQKDRLNGNAPLSGDAYEDAIQFAIRIEKAIEGLVEDASPQS
jgi:hypothetical protein